MKIVFKKEDFDGKFIEMTNCSLTRCCKRYLDETIATDLNHDEKGFDYVLGKHYNIIAKVSGSWKYRNHKWGKFYYKYKLNKIFGDITKELILIN